MPSAAAAPNGTRNTLKNPSSGAADRKHTKSGTNKLRAAALALKITGAATSWGDYCDLVDTDISTLSNEKLKRHLRARNELAEGTKLELIKRLKNSIEEEQQKKIAIELELEAKHRKIADREEQGAVYVTGKNQAGQLGLGDLIDRYTFTVIKQTRGKKFHHVSTGGNIVLATTEKHDVYAWGGSGLGPNGLNSNQKAMYKTPQLVEKLNGEEVIMTSIGANRAVAASNGSDLFVWGLVGGTNTPQPQYLDTITVTSIECGEMHTCAITRENEVYAWGHGATPLPVNLPTSEMVHLIACGSEHTLLSTQLTAYSFGCGDGGRLGHADNSGNAGTDRYEPCEITALRGSFIIDISAGTWHSACIIQFAPLDDSGWLYTWGSGFQGQLGLDKICKASTPTLVQGFVDEGLSLRKVFCGSHHNATLNHSGNLYTWGSNQNGALGRSIDLPFTPHPGIVAEFGTIVDRIGRGLPMSVACGREYTIVATHPYTGPTEEEALNLAKEQQLRRELDEKRQEILMRTKEEELKRLQETEAERKKIIYLTSKRLCTEDSKCPGFTYETNQPSMCRECGFSVVYHTIVVDESNEEGKGKSIKY